MGAMSSWLVAVRESPETAASRSPHHVVMSPRADCQCLVATASAWVARDSIARPPGHPVGAR
jgi:hypothetical protein